VNFGSQAFKERFRDIKKSSAREYFNGPAENKYEEKSWI
jgi:hypothetical protein